MLVKLRIFRVKNIQYAKELTVRTISLSTSLFHDDENSKYARYVVKKELGTEERAKRWKQMHWQHKALFGPLLKTKPEKDIELKIRRLKIGKKVLNLDKPPQSEPFALSKPPYMPGIDDIQQYILLNKKITGDIDVLDFPMMNPWRKDKGRMKSQSTVMANEYQTPYTYPSVTKILQETMSEQSRQALERWKNSMIESLGEEGFARYQQELFQNGRNLHQSIVDLLEGKDPNEIEIASGNEGHWKSLETVFPKIKEVTVLEKSVCHPFLQYKGVVDCVAVYRNKLLVIDWKTSKKLKSSLSSTFDNPLQVVAYLGALNYDQSFNIEVDSAAIIVAYENGIPAHIHTMDRNMCLNYWKKWLERLNRFKILNAPSLE